MRANYSKIFALLWALTTIVASLFYPAGFVLALGYVVLAALLVEHIKAGSFSIYAAILAVVLAQSVLFSGDFRAYFLVAAVLMFCAALFYRHYGLKTKDEPFQGSRAQLDALWSTVVDGLIVINDKGIIVSANPSTTAIFGYTEEQLLGLNVKILMPPRYATEHDGYIDAYNKTREAKIIGKGRDVAGMRKDGTEFPLYLAVNRFEVSGKAYYGGIVRDMSEEVEIRQALTKAKETAEEASQTKSKFLSSISHEVRTPLNAIMGFTQLLDMESSNNLPEKQVKYLTYIKQSADHLLSLFNEILDLSQIESGNLKLSIEAVSAQCLFDECLAMLEPLAKNNGVSLNMIGKLPEHAAVRADRVRLKQALANLLTNAVKYNQAGGSVTAEIQKKGTDFLRFIVTDTGVGIPEEDRDRLFELFNRLGREASTIEGAGIGLAVTRTVVEAMGGKVGFSSELGLGSRFWIDVPVSVQKLEMANILQMEDRLVKREALFPSGSASQQTVLYVEDNPANTILLEQFLGSHSGLKLITVATAEEGLEIAKTEKIDLVLMDLNLPGMDGFEARAALAHSENTKNIPVIAVSADVNFKTIQKAMNVGFRQYIKKPFDLKEAHQAIVSELSSSGDAIH